MTPKDDGARQFTALADRVAQIASENERLVQRLADNEQRFRRLSRGVFRAQESERRRISRELHDGVGQSLTALKMQVDMLVNSDVGQPIAGQLNNVRAMLESALRDVRQLSRLLRPRILDDLGLLPALKWLFRSFEEGTAISVDFVHEGLDRRFDPDVETLAFRIAQEAITNSAKHAGTPELRVRARATATRLFLAVQDRGVGFDPEKVLDVAGGSNGLGLCGMRDRAQLFGARIGIYSAPGAGTLIELEVPFDVVHVEAR